MNAKMMALGAAGVAALLLSPAGGNAQGAGRSRPPVLGKAPMMKLPPIVTRDLPNGLRLLIVEHHELPVASFMLVVGSGGTADPAGRAGLANLTEAMLREGTTTRSSLDIADQTAFLGVNLSTGSDWDASFISLHTPTAQMDSALALFADVALRPAFPATDFERIKKNRLTDILQIKDRGPSMANLAYPAILYGAEYPYGQPLTGNEASVNALTRADLQQFYSTNFRPNNATLIIVGDVTPASIERKISSLFGGWQRGEVPMPKFGNPPAPATTTIYLIDKPGAPQSSFRIGSIGVPRSTRDFFALRVMNTILGGSFSSRLNANLREAKGYTYGARSDFDMRRMAGPFTASAEIVAGKTDSALIEFFRELRSIRETVPADELARAKAYTQLRLPWSFETTQQIAGGLIPLALYGLPLDYYNTFVQNIEAVTQADIQKVARQYINPDNLAVVIVGDRKSIEESLKATNLGPISIRDMTGKPIQ